MVTISGVEKGSRAQRAGVRPGDVLVSMNGRGIRDVLDYRFFETERELRLELLRAGEPYTVELVKPRYASLGLEFDSYLMDRQRSCRNNCVFCFIDQLPKGMRETLYFKDDDDRLSFLFGNYITLTNIDDAEIDRILEMHISPINISVHTMDPELRCKMMNNRFAGESLRHLYRLAQGGDDGKYALPRSHVEGYPLDMSFSGLKTAVLNLLHNAQQKSEELDGPGLAASFQAAVSDILVPRVMEAARRKGYGKIAVAGGVGANSRIRADLEKACKASGDKLFLPPLSLCGDNGAMVGSQGYYEYLAGHLAGSDLNAYATRDVGRG